MEAAICVAKLEEEQETAAIRIRIRASIKAHPFAEADHAHAAVQTTIEVYFV